MPILGWLSTSAIDFQKLFIYIDFDKSVSIPFNSTYKT
jgi:hypothetical protein